MMKVNSKDVQQYAELLAMVEPIMNEKFSPEEIEYLRKPNGLVLIDETIGNNIDVKGLAKKVRELDIAGKFWLKRKIVA